MHGVSQWLMPPTLSKVREPSASSKQIWTSRTAGHLPPPSMKLKESGVRYRRLADSECSTTLAFAAAFVSALVGSTFIPYF
jgi:hypothetical protein